MKTIIDELKSTAGWSGHDGGVVFGVNGHTEYTVDNLGTSAVFAFNGAGSRVAKAFAIDASDRDELVMTIWSRNKGRSRYRTGGDYQYTVRVNGGTAWNIPVYSSFMSVSIPLEVNTVESVEIEAKGDGSDFLVVSGLYAVREDYPLDVMVGVRDGIAYARDAMLGEGIQSGVANAQAGDDHLIVGQSSLYIERYAVVRISDGTTSEFHQVFSYDTDRVTFTDLYDGRLMQNDFAGADVSVWVPVEFGRYAEEAVTPGIVVYAMAPEPNRSTSELETIQEAVSEAGEWRLRRDHLGLTFSVLINCEAVSGYVNAVQNRIVRAWLGSNRVWINGRAHDIDFDEIPVSTDPANNAILGQVQYTVNVDVREARTAPRATASAGPATITVSGG